MSINTTQAQQYNIDPLAMINLSMNQRGIRRPFNPPTVRLGLFGRKRITVQYRDIELSIDQGFLRKMWCVSDRLQKNISISFFLFKCLVWCVRNPKWHSKIMGSLPKAEKVWLILISEKFRYLYYTQHSEHRPLKLFCFRRNVRNHNL